MQAKQAARQKIKVRSEGFDTSLERPQYSGRSEEKISQVQPASAMSATAMSAEKQPAGTGFAGIVCYVDEALR